MGTVEPSEDLHIVFLRRSGVQTRLGYFVGSCLPFMSNKCVRRQQRDTAVIRLSVCVYIYAHTYIKQKKELV